MQDCEIACLLDQLKDQCCILDLLQPLVLLLPASVSFITNLDFHSVVNHPQ